MCGKRILPLLFACLTFIGCEQMDMLDSMHDSTVEMKDTTKKMSKNTDKLRELTEVLMTKTEHMYHQLRSKEARTSRTENFELLKEEKSLEEKITDAVAYLQGFEFHLWTNAGHGIDTNKFRQELMLDAVEEFFRAMKTDLNQVDPWDVAPDTDDNAEKSLFAISLGLHKINHAQEHVKFEKSYAFQKWSFLTMMKTALRNEKLIESGKMPYAELPQWQSKIQVRRNKKAAYGLLNMRFQMIPAIALSSLNPAVKHGNIFEKFRYVLAEWEGDFDKLNLATQEDVVTQLEEAVATKKFLEEQGREARLHWKVAKPLKNMDIRDCPESCLEIEKENLKRFRQSLKVLLKNHEKEENEEDSDHFDSHSQHNFKGGGR